MGNRMAAQNGKDPASRANPNHIGLVAATNKKRRCEVIATAVDFVIGA
jgi:hypothetical protein